MGAKIDLLIKECDDFFNSQFTKFEKDYKSFIDTYNNAITNNQSFKSYSSDNSSKTKVVAKPTSLRILRGTKYDYAPGSILAENKKIFDPDITYSAKTKTNAQFGLIDKLNNMSVDTKPESGIIFYNELGDGIVSKWIIFNDTLEVDNKKIWPRDFFPDKPNIKTYGQFYKWLFNIENGSVFYNEKDVNPSYEERIDPITGENEKNRKVTPVDDINDADFSVPTKLEEKIDLDATQKTIYKELKTKYYYIQNYNKYKYAKEIIAEKYSKKVLEVILSKNESNIILTKWTAKTPNSLWFEGLSGKTPSSNNNIGIVHITSREYPFKQDYYGGSSWFFIDNPWSNTSTLYDALIESINETKDNLIVGSQSETTDPKEVVVKDEKIDPKSIVAKIILKVKSGPGVMIGETEKEIVEGASIFSGIQFDQAGDYVISVGSTSPDVEPTEFKITITPEPVVTPQDESRGKEKEISGNRPIIAQIDKPTIPLPPMVFKQEVNDKNAELVAESIGAMPFVNYMGSPIQDRDIQSLKLYHDGIVPKCKLSFIDSQGFMKTVGAPQGDSKFEIFINAKSNNLKSIHIKFKIESFKDMTDGLYVINGTIDVGDLYRIKSAAVTGTSFEIIRELCKEIGLGFNSNILNTNDSMTWTLNGKKVYEAISDVISHSYISDTSFMSGYIDYYYCFNYVDVEKEMKRDISKDVGIETGLDQKDTADKVVKLKLINEPSMNKSCFYFDNPIIKNNASELSIKYGNQTIYKSYDRTGKTMQIFTIDALTGDSTKSLILKGSQNDKESFNNNFTTKYAGKTDLDNVHNNYLYSVALNERNLDDLRKLEMIIKLPSHNLNLYKFQKVDVTVLNLVPTISTPDKILWRQSGEWVISDITYNFNTENSKKLFFQEIKLIRKELGKTPDESKTEVLEKKNEDNNKVNPNPEPVVPNDAYDLDEIYRVKDSKGEEYWILIKAKTDDGNGVFGQLTSLKSSSAPIEENSNQVTPVTTTPVTTAPAISPPAETPPVVVPKGDQYTIAVENAVSDNAKKITGTITFKKTGPKTGAIGTLNGLPNPFTNPTDGLPVKNNTGSLTYKSQELLVNSSELSTLVNTTIISLEQMVINEYGIQIKLIATSK
jgi:hypothetical protein